MKHANIHDRDDKACDAVPLAVETAAPDYFLYTVSPGHSAANASLRFSFCAQVPALVTFAGFLLIQLGGRTVFWSFSLLIFCSLGLSVPWSHGPMIHANNPPQISGKPQKTQKST